MLTEQSAHVVVFVVPPHLSDETELIAQSIELVVSEQERAVDRVSIVSASSLEAGRINLDGLVTVRLYALKDSTGDFDWKRSVLGALRVERDARMLVLLTDNSSHGDKSQSFEAYATIAARQAGLPVHFRTLGAQGESLGESA